MISLFKSPSITARIERDIIQAVQVKRPGAYAAFVVANLLAKIGLQGMFWLLVGYSVMSFMARSASNSGEAVSEFVSTFASLILGFGIVGVAASITRGILHKDLEEDALRLWSTRVGTPSSEG